MTINRVIWTVIAIMAAVAIPIYGWLSGHWAEMMGGRMLLWGVAWMLILFCEAVVLCVMAIRASAHRLRK